MGDNYKYYTPFTRNSVNSKYLKKFETALEQELSNLEGTKVLTKYTYVILERSNFIYRPFNYYLDIDYNVNI